MHDSLFFTEIEVSQSLKQAAKEIKNQNLEVRDAMKKIAYSFISSHQLSVQEAVYNGLENVLQEFHSLMEICLTIELG